MDRKNLLKKLNLDKFIALDFETTGLQIESDRIIEVAAILFENGEPTKRYVTLVKPDIPIPELIEDITGITNDMVASAPKEKDIVNKLFDFIGSFPIVAHNTPFDLSFLKSLSKRYQIDFTHPACYDTLTLSRAFLFFQPTHNLSAVSEFFGLSSEGAHRAESDTENTGYIFLHLIHEAASYKLDIITRIITLLKPFDIENRKLFIDIANTLAKNGDLKKGLVDSEINKSFTSNVYIKKGKKDISALNSDLVFSENGLLSKSLKGFEKRSNQIRFSSFIDEIFSEPNGIGVAEAGTGLGKTMAYLFPALKKNFIDPDSGPIIISCHTKYLQDQLFNKDLPGLAQSIDVSIKSVLLKGRNNYICKTRLDWLLKSSENILDANESINLLPIIIWLSWTKTGDLDECPGFTNGFNYRLISLIQSEQGYCTTPICARNDGCFFGSIRKLIHKANLIIVNHALLISDSSARLRSDESLGFLPLHDTVIIDEAHNLPQSAYSNLSLSLSHRSIMYALDKVDPTHTHSLRWNNQIKSMAKLHPELEKYRIKLCDSIGESRLSIKPFFDDLTSSIIHKFDSHSKYSTKIIIKNLVDEFGQFEMQLNDLRSNIQNTRNQLRIIKDILLDIDKSREDFLELHQVFERGIETLNDVLVLMQTMLIDQQSNTVYWYEGVFKSINKQKELIITINSSPIDLASDLPGNLFNQLNHCILTSATLQSNASFEYFLQRVGLNQIDNCNIKTCEFESPFYYDEQVTYYQYARDDGQKPQTLSDIIFYCHKKFNKRMMVLFTSRSQLENTLQLLRQKNGGKDLPIFAQRRQTSRMGLIKGMHETSNGILLGTNAFWEGVDLSRDLLEILIIVKMPFDVPTEPIIKAYGNLIESSGGNRFMDFALPESIVRFRQGFGRLIRTSFDEGIFIVMDDRVVSKRYGSAFSNSIPTNMTIFNRVEEVN